MTTHFGYDDADGKLLGFNENDIGIFVSRGIVT